MNSEDDNAIGLFELQKQIKNHLAQNFPTYRWVKVELSELNVNSNGHCYLELVEKKNEVIIAKVRATIWNFTFKILKPYFESSTGYELTAGIKVLLKVSVEFHELYGLTFNIKDIDPSFTIGDIELQKNKTIRRLTEDGIIDMNANIDLPIVIQNIAVISSATAAGYGDWVDQIQNNPYQYQFNYKLFEAQMQGVNTSKSIEKALELIFNETTKYDAVVIIRGGGSKLDLSAFDEYDLAAHIAQFPLPIFTGIGHERDESIVDVVAHSAYKTPTAVADFLIENMHAFELEIENIAYTIVQEVNQSLNGHIQKMDIISNSLNHLLISEIKNSEEQLKHITHKLFIHTQNFNKMALMALESSEKHLRQLPSHIISEYQNKLNRNEKWLSILDPIQVLKRGYAMLIQKGKWIQTKEKIDIKENVEILMQDGAIDTKINLNENKTDLIND